MVLRRPFLAASGFFPAAVDVVGAVVVFLFPLAAVATDFRRAILDLAALSDSAAADRRPPGACRGDAAADGLAAFLPGVALLPVRDLTAFDVDAAAALAFCLAFTSLGNLDGGPDKAFLAAGERETAFEVEASAPADGDLPVRRRGDMDVSEDPLFALPVVLAGEVSLEPLATRAFFFGTSQTNCSSIGARAVRLSVSAS